MAKLQYIVLQPRHVQHGRNVHSNLLELLLVLSGYLLRVQGQQTKAASSVLEIIDQLQKQDHYDDANCGALLKI